MTAIRILRGLHLHRRWWQLERYELCGLRLVDFYSYMVGQLLRRDRPYCSLTNETLWAGWDIVNVDSNSTVDTGSLSWTTTQWHETQYLNTTSLVNVSAGNYSFDVELKWWNTSSSAWETLDSDSDPFVVYTSTGGGGNSSGTNCAVYAWSDFYSYMVGTTSTARSARTAASPTRRCGPAGTSSTWTATARWTRVRCRGPPRSGTRLST